MLDVLPKILLFSLPAVIGILIVFGYVMWRLRGVTDAERIREQGLAAKATVLEVLDSKITMAKNPLVKLRLEVKPDDRAPFEATTECFVPRVAIPRAGDTLAVKFDPDDPSRVALDQVPGK